MPKCSAHSSRTGKNCQKWAIIGGTVCPSHGGKAPAVKAAAQRRAAQQEAAKEFAKWKPGAEPVDDVLGELIKLAGEAVQWKNFISARVAELTELRYQAHTGEQMRAEVALLNSAMSQTHKILESLARLDIAERQVRINEALGVQILAMVDRILEQLDLTPAQRVLALDIVPAELYRQAEMNSEAAIERKRSDRF